MSSVIEKELTKNFNNLIKDTDSQLKELFNRSISSYENSDKDLKFDTINDGNNEKIKQEILKTELDDKGKLVNYIPESFPAYVKTYQVEELEKKDKQNEKELDVEISKLRDIEISNKIRKKDLAEEIGLEEEARIEKEEMDNGEKIDEMDKIKKEEELEESENSPEDKEDKQDEKELDIETKIEVETEIKEEEEVKAELEEEEAVEIEINIENEEEKDEITLEDQEIENEDTLENQEEQESINIIRNRTDNTTKYNTGENQEEGAGEFRWEFNGILTIINGDQTTTETFIKSGTTESYVDAQSALLDSANEFTGIVKEKESDLKFDGVVKDSLDKILFSMNSDENQKANYADTNNNEMTFLEALNSQKNETSNNSQSL